ncbi:hypothetical protein I302_105694 [Kwoniella bestiolae CBS 10118]|uniref:Striatin N-terminal domain-containing protein n=1 Tax=Kwoniella bestiolae CBS 10118 TaxID=1296100 RepID=A0A1B9G1V6_9TREE|nr:hypothetical protein I302_04814 [Kwoniella bestiolae CBS 10118]OCF25004.1 hypothetical protein I302_04814 [Kwoniella bestiolae CBS 10118]
MFRNVPQASQQQQSYPPQQQQYAQPQQQQYNQQPQQQQNVQQQQPQQGGGSTVDGGSGSNGGSGQQEMNLASVLHYLQSEWRRWERDRNEWEIERAEMRARIALLEGQRRSAENLKVDLLRRVKMLEFALRQERTKTVSSASGKVSSIPPSKLALLQDEDKMSTGSKDDNKEGSGSEGSQEDLAERSSGSLQPTSKLNGVHPASMGKSAQPFRQSTGDSNSSSSAWKNIGSAPRDPKARARSREYLKQCLQEISYLTSPGALNPLPPRPPVDQNYPLPDPNNPNASTNPNEQIDPLDRPRKSLPDQNIPSIFASSQPTEEPSQPNENQNLPNGTPESKSSSSYTPSDQAAGQHSQPSSSDMSLDPTAKPPSSPAPRTVNLPEGEQPPQKSQIDTQVQAGEEQGGNNQILTAIYRPDSKAAWREELRNANEMAEKAKEDRKPPSSSADEDQLSSLTLNAEEDESKVNDDNATNGPEDKVWSTRRSLKSHLDIVRAVAFAHGPGVVLATGGDDCTVKVWGVDVGSVMSQKPSAHEIEPLITYRGHTAPITSIVISSALSIIFSASLDSTIRLWKLPSIHHDPYSIYDSSLAIQTLEGHTDSIWGLVLLPSREVNGKKMYGKLISASSDGSIKIWSKSTTSNGSGEWQLKSSFSTMFNKPEIPTCLEGCNSDYGHVYVGTSRGRVLLVDTDSDEGKVLQVFGEESEDQNSQINAILSHPTLPAIATAGEDGYIRFYDIKSNSSSPTHSILAHPSPITSLSISPLSPTCILTSSTDCSVRLWDLGKKTCLQDLSGHRERSGEGVNMVASHPELPIVGTAGADGVVRLWGAG